MPSIMQRIDRATGYRLPGSADRLSKALAQDRASARSLGKSVTEPTGPTIKQLDRYVTDTARGKIARYSHAAERAKSGEMPEYKKGGMVKKTGPAKLHKGERVLTKSQTKKYSMRKG